MKTVKDTQYLISETTREIKLLKGSSDIKKKLDRIGFLRDVIFYLESEPREVYLKNQESLLQDRISKVDEKIETLRSVSRAPIALANQIKAVKAEFNYDKHKKQLDVIQFILN